MGFFDNDTNYELVNPGVYVATLDNATLDETKDVPKLSLTYSLNNKRKIWQNFTVNEKSAIWLSWQLGIIGSWQEAKETCKDDQSSSLVARACLDSLGKKLGTKFEMTVEHNEYNGKTYANGKLERPLTDDEAKALSEMSREEKPLKNHALDIDKDEELGF